VATQPVGGDIPASDSHPAVFATNFRSVAKFRLVVFLGRQAGHLEEGSTGSGACAV
jgi:hypothetical protein